MIVDRMGARETDQYGLYGHEGRPNTVESRADTEPLVVGCRSRQNMMGLCPQHHGFGGWTSFGGWSSF